MKLGVIIVVYKSEAVIFNCLDSINRYNDLGDNLEVIIVDNDLLSTLGEELDASKYGYALKYQKAEGNNGFGAGNNLGASFSTSEVLLFLNPDTVLVESLFYDVYGAIHEDKNLVYGFSLTDKDGGKNNSYSFFYDSFLRYRFLSLVKRFSYQKPIRSRVSNKYVWPWGAAFAINREVFLNAGGFDENIFLCNEEPDLLKRLPQRRVFISDHNIIHLEGHGTVVSENRYYHAFKSFKYYQDKYSMSKFNRTLWDIYVRLLCIRYKLFSNDESNVNYVKAYNRIRKEYTNK